MSDADLVRRLIGDGLTNHEIGKRLYLSEKTVKNHISRLLAKLGVQRRVQAAVLASHLDQPNPYLHDSHHAGGQILR